MRKFALIPLLFVSLASCQDNASYTNASDEFGEEDTRPKSPCAAIENMLATEEDCADLTALQNDVKPGPAALDAPAAMVRGRNYEVTLVIDRKQPAPPPAPPPPPPPPEPEPAENAMDSVENAADADENLSEVVEPAAGARDEGDEPPTANQVVAQLPGANTYFRARVGRYMKATLTGSGFDIKTVEPLDGMQEIPRGGQGRWQWEVTPTAEGKRRLTVKTQALGKVDGRMVPLGNGDTSRDIDVTVTPWDKFWDRVKEATSRIDAMTAFFVALGALIVAVRPVRRAIWGFLSRLFKRRKSPPRE